MKIKLGNRYLQIGITIFLTALALMAVYFLFFRIATIKSAFSTLNKILTPVYCGFIFAYLMSPLMNSIEGNIMTPIFKKVSFLSKVKNQKKKIRGFSILFTLIIVLLLIYLFFAALIPQIYNSIQNIISNYNKYTSNLVTWFQEILDENPSLNNIVSQIIFSYSSEADDYLNSAVLPAIKQFLLPNINDILMNLSSSIIRVVLFFYNFIIGLIISIYVLNSKEKFLSGFIKSLYAIFDTKTANNLNESIRFIHKTFIGFLSGKVVDSAIVGVICYILSLILGLPYPVLIGVIVGVTNIIPFFGPYFGAIPSVIIIMMVDPMKALYFIIMILILQQVDGNLIGPMILSESTGLTSFWIIFSITLFGGLFGLAGMIVGVPVTAVIFTGINKVTNGRLTKKNLPLDNFDYYNIDGIDEEGKPIPHVEPPKNKKEIKKSKVFIVFSNLIIKIKDLFNKKSKHK